MTEPDLLSLILDGTAAPNSWSPLLEKIPTHFAADLSLLTLKLPNGADVGAVAGRTANDPIAVDWLETLGKTGVLEGLKRGEREHATIRIDLMSDSMSDLPLREWAGRNDCRSAMHGLVWRQGENAGLLSVFRRNGKMFDDADEARFRDLLRPLGKGVLTRQSLEQAARGVFLGHAVLNTLFVGAAILTADRRIVHANDMANSLMKENDAVCCEDGRLATAPCAGLKIADEFSRHLEDVVKDPASFPFRTTAPLLIPREGRSNLSIVLAPLGDRPIEGFPAHERPIAIAYLSVPEKFTELAPTRLQRAYGLTVTEADLAIALATGKSLRQAALDADRSEATLRKHLQSIFAKTGTHRQSELVSRLLRRIV